MTTKINVKKATIEALRVIDFKVTEAVLDVILEVHDHIKDSGDISVMQVNKIYEGVNKKYAVEDKKE